MISFHSSRAFLFGAAILALGTSAALGQGAGAPRKVSLRFRAMVGAEPFACGKSYPNIGKSHTTITPADFAMYVHDVKLLTADGTQVPLTLDQDGLYQDGTLALLDFEDGTGPCSNGNASTHTEIRGTAPAGQYTGVSFVIGVPFERNHLDLTTQPPLLSITRLFWAWNSGHQFVRVDATSSTGKSWVFHLGSTGCTPSGRSSPPTTCAHGNRVNVSFPQFDVDVDAVVADLATLFAGVGGSGDESCMSAAMESACGPMFGVLGLPHPLWGAVGIPYKDSPTGPQTFLRVLAGGASSRTSGQ